MADVTRPATTAADGTVRSPADPGLRDMAPSKPERRRPRVDGKFFYVGDEKLLIRGVTYGPFASRAPGDDGYDPATAEHDFREMASNGVNAVRLYDVPEPWMLDAAARHDLYVLVGVPWEQHVAFLELPGVAKSVEQRIRAAVRVCAGHPSVLGFAIGNEIPARIVRWHGPHRVERFLERMCQAVHEEDPKALVTYVNYPSTEYLRVPAVDFHSYNVYLEDPERYEAYLSRLQNLAARSAPAHDRDRPGQSPAR